MDAKDLAKSKDHRSVTAMCNFSRCPRKYCWQKQFNLERPSPQRDLAMRFGSAIHAGAPFTHTKEIEKALETFRDVWADGDEFEDQKRNFRVGRNILLDMMVHHGGRGFVFNMVEPKVKSTVEQGMKGLHEISFDVDCGLASGKPLTGRIDGLMTHKGTGRTWILEYKTASQLWKTFGDVFVINPQMELYALAMGISGQPVEGGLVEGVLVSKTKTEILPVLWEVDEEIVAAGLEWLKWQDKQLAELEASAPSDPLQWPMNRAACTPSPEFGLQGFLCDYQPLCSAGSRWKGLLGMYQQQEYR